jgi:3'(2'), 5'-bisphosphate nucleotidase
MDKTDVHITLRALIAIAQEAGDVVMRHYRTGAAVRRKADKSPVTDADHEAEALILNKLHNLALRVPVIAEEEAAAGRLPPIGEKFFLVDPLDGTREFVDRNGEFTVNIALIEHGAPVMGVVYAPAKDRLFAGAIGDGAIEIAKRAEREITARPVPKEGMIAVASRSHRDRQTEELLNAYPIGKLVTAGSSLKFCMIAAGEADFYPRHGRTMEWDTAAGHAVLAAADGAVTLLDGRTPLTYGKVGAAFANPHFLAWGRRMAP